MESAKPKVLIVEDDKLLVVSLIDVLTAGGYQVTAAENCEMARPLLASTEVAIIDLRLPDKPGIELVKELKETNPEAEALITTGYADVQSAIEACNLGAFAYLEKPVTLDRLLLFLKRALERRQMALEIKRREQEIKGLTGFTGDILNDRVRLLEQDKGREETLSRLYRSIDMAFRSLSPVEAARSLLPLIADETRANNAVLSVIGTDGKVMDRTEYFKGMSPFKVVSRGGGTRDDILKTKRPRIIPDLAKHPNPNPDRLAAGIRSTATYPLIVDGVVCGTLLLSSLSKDGFAGMDQIIASFADLCAIPLRQSILLLETERTRKTWEATVNAMRIGVAIIDMDRNILQANNTLASMLRVPLEDLPGKKICPLIHGHPQPISECRMEKVCNSSIAASIVINERFLNIKRLEIRIAPITDDQGKPTHFVYICRDLDIFRNEDKPYPA